MSIVTNENRHGKFTSSQISKLIKSGRSKADNFSAAGLTYIEEKYFERKRKRSLSNDAGSRSTAWGNIMEKYVFSILGFEYSITSDDTTLHKLYPNIWAGSCDLIVPNMKIAEIKCYEAKKFCQYAEVLLSKDIQLFKDEFADEYWQIVSNCCINEVDQGEAILYLPYDLEAEKIKEFVDNYEGNDIWKYRYIFDEIEAGNLHKLPFQPDNSDYPSLVTFDFEVPKEDKEYLTSRVLEAETFLQTKYYKK